MWLFVAVFAPHDFLFLEYCTMSTHVNCQYGYWFQPQQDTSMVSQAVNIRQQKLQLLKDFREIHCPFLKRFPVNDIRTHRII